MWPKVLPGGCFAAHNVTGVGSWFGGIAQFLAHLKTIPDAQTTIDSSGGGVSISYKRAP